MLDHVFHSTLIDSDLDDFWKLSLEIFMLPILIIERLYQMDAKLPTIFDIINLSFSFVSFKKMTDILELLSVKHVLLLSNNSEKRVSCRLSLVTMETLTMALCISISFHSY